MRVVFLNIYQGQVQRGAETFVRELSERLKRNHEIVVMSGNKIPPKRWPFVWHFFVDPNGLYILWFTLKTLPLLWKEKFDIVIPLNGGWQSTFVRIVTWLYGGKVIISGQSGMGWDDRHNLWSFPNVFVAISSFAGDWAKKANPLVRVQYIPNGVDLQKFSPSGRKFSTQLKHPIVLCVAALTVGKRVDLAIKATAAFGNASILVVGDGPLREKIHKLGMKLLGEQFQLIKMSYEELPTAYRVADVFTIPSESYHSFEIVLVEAMATNLPVVANNDLIREEIVGDAGILVNPTDTNAYAAALKKALNAKQGDKPRRQAEKFSWDKIAKQYEELFKKL
ncbi:MAG: glycosyltransferase family 4 protein [Patescibacteria group bacterium]